MAKWFEVANKNYKNDITNIVKVAQGFETKDEARRFVEEQAQRLIDVGFPTRQAYIEVGFEYGSSALSRSRQTGFDYLIDKYVGEETPSFKDFTLDRFSNYRETIEMNYEDNPEILNEIEKIFERYQNGDYGYRAFINRLNKFKEKIKREYGTQGS